MMAVKTEEDKALWGEVQASVKKGQFAVLTFFVEDDEVIHRFSHLSFQAHLCAMVLRRRLARQERELAELRASLRAANHRVSVLQSRQPQASSPPDGRGAADADRLGGGSECAHLQRGRSDPSATVLPEASPRRARDSHRRRIFCYR